MFGDRQVAYDAAGRRTQLSFFSEDRPGHLDIDTSQTYSYDSNSNRLTRIGRQGAYGDQKAEYAYADGDRLTTVTYGNGAYTIYAYWASGALSKISHYDDSDSVFYSMAYAYDKAGNVTTVTLEDALANDGDATVAYWYDDVHRLTREKCTPDGGSDRPAFDQKYTYDASGNRLSWLRTDEIALYVL